MKSVDPVCGMEVDDSTRFKSLYKGKLYLFCSAGCKREFDRDPEKYLREGPKGMGHVEGRGRRGQSPSWR